MDLRTAGLAFKGHRRWLLVGLVLIVSAPFMLMSIKWINQDMKSRLSEDLLAAVKAEDVECARELLRRGADPNTRLSPEGMSCLFLARGKMAELLLAHGADPNMADGNTGYQAIHCVGDSETAEILIRYGANVNAYNPEGFTPLHVVSDCEAGRILIKHGALVNACTIDGDTALDLATSDGREDFAEMLLEHGAKKYDDLNDNEVQSSPFWQTVP